MRSFRREFQNLTGPFVSLFGSQGRGRDRRRTNTCPSVLCTRVPIVSGRAWVLQGFPGSAEAHFLRTTGRKGSRFFMLASFGNYLQLADPPLGYVAGHYLPLGSKFL